MNGAAAGQEPAAGSPGDEVLDELSPDDLARLLGDGNELAAKVYENFVRYQALAARDRENMARLTQRLDEDCIMCVPYLDEDVHDIESLAQVNSYLFGTAGERDEMLA
jgi:hypothetical protein